MDTLLGYLDVFLLVFVRMGALLFMNPVFSRKNVPMMARAGLVFSVSLLLAPLQDGSAVSSLGPLDFVLAMIRELGLGLLMGMVFQIYYYMLYVAGDLMDTVFGLSMAKVMDPVSSVQASVWGQMLNMLFVLYFFATGSHLLMIRLFAYSYEAVPVGAYSFLFPRVASYLLTLRIYPCGEAGSALCGCGVRCGSCHGDTDEADSPDSCICNQSSDENHGRHTADDSVCPANGGIYRSVCGEPDG